MKKILFLLLISSFLTSGAFAGYQEAMEFVRIGNYPSAVEALKDSLTTDPKSQYLMGFMYYHGLGVNKSYRQALDFFTKSMNGGNTDSRTFLAYMYDEGKGVNIDKQKAFNLYQESAEEGDTTAITNLAVMYYRGSGIPQNYDKAFNLMNSVEYVKDPIVQYYLGDFYFYGFGVSKDLKKAIAYYIRSAMLGSVDAHYMLGHIYQNGFGTQTNIPKATKYYEYAALAGNPQAQFNLATVYTSGQLSGIIDKVKAYAWLSIASKNNFTEAIDALSKLSETMSLSEISKAKELLISINKQIAAKENIPSESANENLGDMVFKAPPRKIYGSTFFGTTNTNTPSKSSRIKRTIRRR